LKSTQINKLKLVCVCVCVCVCVRERVCVLTLRLIAVLSGNEVCEGKQPHCNT